MFYRRQPIESYPSGGFFYALAFEDANYIQIGVGHESRNGLQLSHIKTIDLHHEPCLEILQGSISDNGGLIALLTGRLSVYFGDEETVILEPYHVERLLAMVREVRDEGWGDPLDWETTEIPLKDKRFAWVAYGADINKIRVGLGYYSEAGETVLGDHAYAVGPITYKEFVAQLWMDPSPLFMGRTAGWPAAFFPFIAAEEKQALAKQIVKLADILWPKTKS